MTQRILVTGGNGFVGSNIVRRLAETSHVVSVLSRDSTVRFPGDAMAAKPMRGDLVNLQSLLEATRGIDTIVHAAGVSRANDPAIFAKVNERGTALLCEAACRNGVQRVIFISTAGVYGHRRHRNTAEDCACSPDTPYSRSKRAAEEVLLAHHAAGHFRAVILRPRFVYGIGDRSVIPSLVKTLRRLPVLIDGGRGRHSFVSAEFLAEVVQQFVEAAELPAREPLFNVTDDVPITFHELASALCRQFALRMPSRSLPFMLLYAPTWLAEAVLRIDPERSPLPLSTIRLTMFGGDNFFSGNKLRNALPRLASASSGSLRNGLPAHIADYYHRLLAHP